MDKILERAAALELFARVGTHPHVNSDAHKRLHRKLVHELNAAMEAELEAAAIQERLAQWKPEPVAAARETLSPEPKAEVTVRDEWPVPSKSKK